MCLTKIGARISFLMMLDMNDEFRNILVLLIGVLTSIAGIAQTPLSLSQAVEKGWNNNFDIRISQINTTIADKQLKAAKKERLPTINISANQGNSIINDRSPTTFINDFYRDRNFSLGVDGDWMLFDGFQGKLNKQIYRTTKEERELMGKVAIENTTYEILLAYYDVLVKKEALQVARESKALSVERLVDIQLKTELGQSSRYDALRFENAVLLDSTSVLDKERELESAMLQLNEAMGNKKNRIYSLTDPLNYKAQRYDLAKMKRKLTQQNKNLLSQNLSIELVKLKTKAIENSRLPTVSLNSGVSQRFNGTNFPEIPRIKGKTFQFYFRIAANYNLFDGGRRSRAIEENQLLEQIEVVKTEQLQTRLEQELTASINAYHKQMEVLQITDQLIKNLELNMQLEKDRYIGGFSSALNFRTVQLEYINAEFTRISTLYELVVNELNILRLTGDLRMR